MLTDALAGELGRVEPSVSDGMRYAPCRVQLRSGVVADRVYVVEAESYIRYWGVWPWEDEGKNYVPLQDVTAIEESLYRMPAQLANKMYAAGESAMGGCFFSLLLRGGDRVSYSCGNAIDFVGLPADVSWSDVVDLVPHERAADAHGCMDYGWSLYRSAAT
jgi:hypothetical protein